MRFSGAAAAAVVMTILLLPSAPPSESDTPTVGPAPIQLKEVVVTAEKRQETVLRIPVAVSVLTQQQLLDQGVIGLAGIASTVPDVQMKTLGFTNGIQVSIRGISNTDFNEAGNPAVATYIDGFYVGRSEGLEGDLYDLGRVEIVRGPQGTLYGRNSTGGNINILTADPTETLGGYGDVSYGNYSDLLAHAVINIPITGTLAVRASVETHQSGSYYNTEGTTDRGYGEADDHAGRVVLLWKPTNGFRWRLAADDFIADGTPGLDIAIGPNGKPLDGLPVLTQPTPSRLEPYNHLNNMLLRSRMDLALGDQWSLTYITGYQDLQDTAQVGLGPNIVDSLRRDPFRSYSHEVDVNFDSARLKNTSGATYFHMWTTSPDAYHFYPIESNFGIPQADRVITEAWGLFDQATFNVTDSLRLIGGVRYSSERQHALGALIYLCPLSLYPNEPLDSLGTLFGPGCATSTVVPAAGRWSHVDWKAGLEYDFSDHTSAYATVTTGFKSGGANVGFNTPLPNFAPEKVTNFELGVKTRLLDDRLSVNTDVFFENYRDIQVTQVSSTTYSTITENAAGAHIYGMENEVNWLATGADELSGFIDYLHSTYTQYLNAVDQLTGDIIPSLDGNYLPNAPVWSGKLQYQHEFGLPNGGTLTPSVSSYWQSKSYLREFNEPIDLVGSYSKTGADLTYVDPSGHWRLQGYADNLENKLVRNEGFTVLNHYFSNYSAPRTYGVRVSYKY